jgi:hypothetical protein
MEKRIFDNIMNFLLSYEQNEITFEWATWDRSIENINWEYGHSNLGRKKIPPSIMNIIVSIIEEFAADDLLDDAYSESEGYQLKATFRPKNKTLELRVSVEEYVSEEIYNERKFPIETSNAIKYMNEKNISNIIFSYDGGGDSGEINSLLVDGKEVSIYTWERNEETMPIINMAYEYLENTYGGWEIDDGSSGTLEIKDNGLISSSHIWSSREWFDSGLQKIITIDDFK